jgi:hypothetical protein
LPTGADWPAYWRGRQAGSDPHKHAGRSGTGTAPSDFGNAEIGLRFRTDCTGGITRIRFCREDRDAQHGKSHTGRLWSANGTLLRSVAFTHMSNRGWQEAVLGESLAIQPGVEHVASVDAWWWVVRTTNGHTEPLVNGHLTGLASVHGKLGACPTSTGPHLMFGNCPGAALSRSSCVE